MLIPISNAIQQTWMVVTVLLILLVLSIRYKKNLGFFPPEVTAELKGLAILLVVLSHIGYFLVSDNRFLVPLSNYAGVGVDLFLILSGYGLVVTALKRPLKPLEFYKRRLSKVYVPMLITVGLFLILDATILNRYYPVGLTIRNLFGYYPMADLYQNIDSPMWFMTLLLSYYLIFPWIFWRKAPVVSAALLATGYGYLIYSKALYHTEINGSVINLYMLHFLGLPLGMLFGSVVNQLPTSLEQKLLQFKSSLSNGAKFFWRFVIVALSVAILLYFSYYPAAGESRMLAQLVSLAMALAVLAIFVTKKTEFKLFYWFGVYSFEIYLLHWPILYRYDFLYKKIPAGYATLGYLAIFLVLGFGFQQVLAVINRDRKVLPQ